jgi:pyruvate dehydrogenase E1 component alpha subunit
MTALARFQVEHVRFLDPQGEAVQPLPEFAQDREFLISLYRAMVLTRTFDAKAIALQRTGKLGTFASSLGQEAMEVGTANAMRAEDVLLPSYRDHGAQLLRGVAMTEILQSWSGDERGNNYAIARSDFPNCIPIAGQVCHAAGVAYAMKLRREARVAVCLFGDGATSKGDFYEAMNIAGAWGLPMVMVINNNQWAISVPRSAQSAAKTLAQKAIAAGIDGRQVDGNDVIAVHQVVREAVNNARRGDGPALIEGLSYRLGDHTTADDASRYRDAESLQEQWRQEPIVRLRNYLAKIGAWDKEREEQLARACAEQVAQAVDSYLAIAPPGPEEMFDHLYAALPAAMREQRAEALRYRGEHG